MFDRPRIAMYLLILCAVTIGCGTSAEPTVNPESLAAARNAAPPGKTAEEEAAEKKAHDEKAAENKAAEEKVANSYVKVKVEVELRGVLTCTDEAATLSIVTDPFTEVRRLHDFAEFKEVEVKWLLDFGAEKESRAKAKALDGKTVLVTGSAILRGVKSETVKPEVANREGRIVTRSVLDLEPKVVVKCLVAATKE